MDIQSTLHANGETAHYPGYLVRQSAEDKTVDVIDGQQRLTTITILLLAILKNLQRLAQRGLHAPEHAESTAGHECMRLAQLGEDRSDRLFFTVITVTDEPNAYKVFGTLNARGVRLSATALLKNYLFSLLDSGAESDHELRSLEDRWELVVGRLQAENFPDFLRAHWIRSAVRTRQAAFQLLREIEEDLDTYLALSSPEPSGWSPGDDKQLAGTLQLFRVHQPFPLLLAARRSFAPADFTALLRATVVISMRFNVIGSYSTGEQERRYNEVAEHIATRQLTTLTHALQRLRSIYPEDSVFRSAFATKIIRTTDSRNNKVVSFLLCALEKHLSGQDLDFASATFNIEHVRLAAKRPRRLGLHR